MTRRTIEYRFAGDRTYRFTVAEGFSVTVSASSREKAIEVFLEQAVKIEDIEDEYQASLSANA